ncbi:MAG TPA: TonB-dependent receptor [Ferruginibacter sp.]|nr:TonB-dependent receptor [Ferruginibacter sp.]HMP21724.1 TonB-dependent receptor [Ferruginibacter sp.]
MLPKSFTLLCFLFTVATSIAQFPGGRNGANMNVGHLYGKIVDGATNKGIEAASVQLIQNKFDSATKKRQDVIVAGMLTDKRGEFSLENLPVMAAYKLKITAIGYKSIEQKAAFDLNPGAARGGDMSSMLNMVDKDLGNIKMQLDAQQLEEVTITNTKPLLTMGIDRKIFNVERNLTSIGGTAVDVMKNVPGLNVDIDGNVSLRNATPQLFVDGRPTTMTLEQIPADAIATIEIITNPSAKFDASGGGAGILNVVMKKNRKTGYNGNLRAGIDSRARGNLGGDINIRQGKVNFFAAGNLGFRKTISTVKTDRTDFDDNFSVVMQQNNRPVGQGTFGFARTGMDYFIDNRNTISIAANFSKGQFRNKDLIRISRDTVYDDTNLDILSETGNRTNDGKFNFSNIGTTLSYKHNFAKTGKEITADVNYNYNSNTSVNDFSTQYFNAVNTPKTPLIFERYTGGGNTKFFTSQVDYDNPITKNIKIETGARIALRDFTSYNYNFVKLPNSNDYVQLTALDNDYKFSDRVLAAYGTFSQKLEKFNYQIGLRIENSEYNGTLITKDQKFSNEFPFALFPSAFATWTLKNKQDIQLNYSRKVNRPNFFQLIPFVDFTDSLNLSRGNPDLIPEFTNLLELSYQKQFTGGHNLLTTLYYRNTNNLITRYQFKTENPNPQGKPDSVIMTTYANASNTYSYGLELTGRNKLASWWDVTTNFNFFNVTLNAGNLPGGINSSQVSWFAKMNHNFKLPKSFSIQLSGDYQAKTLVQPDGGGRGRGGGRGMFFGGGNIPSAQGFIRPFYGVDIAIRKDFLKNNAASLTLQVNDIFKTKYNRVFSESIYFVQDVERIRDPQLLRLNFNWRFGKLDVALFKRKNTRSDMESIQNSMQQGAN